MNSVLLRKALVSEFPSSRNAAGLPDQRRFAIYNNEIVLIDPKKYGEDPNDAFGIRVWDRVQYLAETLGSLRSSDFLALRCKGFFEDESQRQFCFVYELPPTCEQPSMPTPPSSLLQYVSSSFKPSLTKRFRLAHCLALSIRKIHDEGWLHKGIRSENVLFFLTKWNGKRSLDDPRLVGFDFARKEGPEEYSEKPMNTDANIYRHPDTLRDPTTSFTRAHDYYSLGVVLVEIAAWRSIKAILRTHQGLQGGQCKENDVRKVRDILLDEESHENHPRDIMFRMGDEYWNAVEICLRGDFEVPRNDNDWLTAAFAQKVVDRLGKLSASV